MKYLLILSLFLVGCAKESSDKLNGSIEFADGSEQQLELPHALKTILAYKEVYIGVKAQVGGCLPTGCTLGGIGKDTYITYNTKTCYLDTTLVKNYRINFHYLTISPRVEDIPNFNYQPNPTECSELIGTYWIHYSGGDHHSVNSEMTRIN